jgi:hypothetical protein
MAENNGRAQRTVRIDARGGLVYELGKPAPRRGGAGIVRMGQVSEGVFRVDLEPVKVEVGKIKVEREIQRFIAVFNPVSVDIEETDAPKIQPLGVIS